MYILDDVDFHFNGWEKRFSELKFGFSSYKILILTQILCFALLIFYLRSACHLFVYKLHIWGVGRNFDFWYKDSVYTNLMSTPMESKLNICHSLWFLLLVGSI